MAAARPSRWAARPIPASGARRFRSTSWASALSGETYSTRTAVPWGRRRAGSRDEAVEAPQERGQGLAAPGGCVDERVLPGRDRRPAPAWAAVGRLEGSLEPGADGGVERRQRVVGVGLRPLAGLRTGHDGAAKYLAQASSSFENTRSKSWTWATRPGDGPSSAARWSVSAHDVRCGGACDDRSRSTTTSRRPWTAYRRRGGCRPELIGGQPRWYAPGWCASALALASRCVQPTARLGIRIDVTSVADALEDLDGPPAPRSSTDLFLYAVGSAFRVHDRSSKLARRPARTARPDRAAVAIERRVRAVS